jgi:hypothetical protein
MFRMLLATKSVCEGPAWPGKLTLSWFFRGGHLVAASVSEGMGCPRFLHSLTLIAPPMVVCPQLFSKRASAAWGRKAAELARFVNNCGRGALGAANRSGSTLVESARLAPLRLGSR